MTGEAAPRADEARVETTGALAKPVRVTRLAASNLSSMNPPCNFGSTGHALRAWHRWGSTPLKASGDTGTAPGDASDVSYRHRALPLSVTSS